MRTCCGVFRAVAADGRSCQPERMISKKTATKEAGRFAAALAGPLGPRPVQRVVFEFRPLFRDLRATGASWGQIAALLASVGVRARSGHPLKEADLHAMVSRAERDGAANGSAVTPVANDIDSNAAAATISTPVPRPSAPARKRWPEDASNPALKEISERIRRASALRAKGDAGDG